jgi:hypothetical protein
LQFALETSRSSASISQLVAFLLLDACVETAMRIFLSLPDGSLASDVAYFERRKYSSGNFHDLTTGIRRAAKNRVSAGDLHQATYYHGIRNQLYHRASGITVDPEDVRGYSRVAASLLRSLLDVHHFDTEEAAPRKTSAVSQDSFVLFKKQLREDLERFRALINELIETLEPRLIYPSTISRLHELSINIEVSSFSQKLSDFRDLIEQSIRDREIRSWLLDLVSGDIYGDGKQALDNAHLVLRLGEDHISLYSLIIGLFFVPVGDVRREDLNRWEDMSFVESPDYSIMGIYNGCSLWEAHLAPKDTMTLDDLPMCEAATGLHEQLKATIKRLEGLLPV